MPFRKVGEDDYIGPSGKHFTKAQVELYYARGGSFPGKKRRRKKCITIYKSDLRAALEQAKEIGRREAEARFDAMLARFHRLKELNGSGEIFKAEWDESKHPRDAGRFASSPGNSGSAGETGTEIPDHTATHKTLATAMPELSPEHFEAVGDYTGGSYVEINKSLREGRAATKGSKAIPLIAAAIDSAPTLEKPVTVYRGLRLTADQREAFLAKLKSAAESGELLEEPGFMSTSLNPKVATGFASGGSGSEAPLVFQVSARKGLYLGESVGGTKEMELLLQKGSRFKVAGIEGNVVKLEQVL